MYPTPPYPTFSWSMNHHMGVVNSRTLFACMFAAATYCDSDDPKAEINNYLNVNNVFTRNIRNGQVDTWRDYQQILPELGLIISTQIQRRITPTPLGLAYLDGAVGFAELMSLQALRYQYPNGQKESFVPAQLANNVLIRPGVLIWRVLRGLQDHGYEARITIDEIQSYLARCTTHEDTNICLNALINARNGGTQLAPSGNRRDFQEWIRFLLKTPLFIGNNDEALYLQISNYAQQSSADIDLLCTELEDDESFWLPNAQGELSRLERFDWFAYFGSFDLGLDLLPEPTDNLVEGEEQFIGEREDDLEDLPVATSNINLRDFNRNHLRTADTPARRGIGTIQSSYDAGLADNKHRLHDLMVIYIAELCTQNGARVFDDPGSVDLLVEYENTELIIEVKSVTSRNFIKRLRYALGQVCHYDYLRSRQNNIPRRKIIAITARLPQNSWCIPFMNNHMDIDLLSLKGQVIQIDSNVQLVQRLFMTTNNVPRLPI